MTEGGDFYRGGGVSKAEIERLNLIERPNETSKELLGGLGVEGKYVLDVGAGSNPELGMWIEREKGSYAALELRADMIQSMRTAFDAAGLPFEGVQGDIVAGTEFPADSFDVVHERFVLMNLKPETRTPALREMVRLARESVVLMEYDWNTFTSTSHPELIQSVKAFIAVAFPATGTDPFMGEKLERFVAEVEPELARTRKTTLEPEGTKFAPELMALMRGMESNASQLAAKTEDPALKERYKLGATMSALYMKQLEDAQPTMVPPAIESITIHKKK